MPNTKREIANALYDGKGTQPYDFFAKGKEFVKKHVIDGVRYKLALEAEKFLEAQGISLPRSRYTNFTRELLSQSISGNSKLGQLEADSKSRMGAKYEARARKKIGDRYGAKYGWMQSIRLKETTNDLTNVLAMCPIAGLDPMISNLYLKIGYSTSKNVFEFHPERLLSFLRRDPKFPRFLTADNVFAIMSKPEIVYFEQNAYHMLICLGLDQKIAAEALSMFRSRGEMYKMLTEASIVSSNDHICGILDLSRTSYNRMVSLITTGDTILDSTLYLLGFSYVIFKYFETGKLTQITLLNNDVGYEKMKQKFTGRTKTYSGLRYLGLFNTDHL